MFIIIGISFLAVYSLLTYYVFRKLRHFHFSIINPKVIQILFLLWALCVPASFLLPLFELKSVIKLLGYYYLYFFFYYLLLILAIDILFLLNKFLHISQGLIHNKKMIFRRFTYLYIFLFFFIYYYGSHNSDHSVVKELKIELNENKTDSLTVLFSSDLHLNEVSNSNIILDLIQFHDQYHPDIILLGGDIIDRDIQEIKYRNYQQEIQFLASQVPIFAISGNHELMGDYHKNIQCLNDMGIQMLIDSMIVFQGKIRIAGRQDRAAVRFNKKSKSLKSILSPENDSLPLIVLDHTPSRIDEAVKNHTDLILSGHTHNGQIIPLNFITKLMFPISWGYGKFEDTHCYVSCGQGTWGPPFRIGSHSEIVFIKIYF